ncbi:MAG: hypothetical protein K9G13_03690 [Aquiluna sp.]|nr:hypothetical protein [Aquiluna sp.]MCF8545622.1 hypothetical protein [Aquiluna sp.]
MPDFNPIKCALYTPGHNVHYIQAKVYREAKKYPATVELISTTQVRVKTRRQDQVLYNHNATELYMQALAALNGEINYAPNSHLLYILHEQASKSVKEAWLMASLSEKPMGDCKSQEEVWPVEELLTLEGED